MPKNNVNAIDELPRHRHFAVSGIRDVSSPPTELARHGRSATALPGSVPVGHVFD
jgi:hypothetical protein